MSLPVLPCPFCRGQRLGLVRLQVGPVPVFGVNCGSCGAAGPMASGPETAIELWNRADRLTGHAVCRECKRVCSVHFQEPVVRPCVLDGPPTICSECSHRPPRQPAASASVVATKGAGTKTPLRFCEADTLISEPDGSVSVKRGPCCSCPKEGT